MKKSYKVFLLVVLAIVVVGGVITVVQGDWLEGRMKIRRAVKTLPTYDETIRRPAIKPLPAYDETKQRPKQLLPAYDETRRVRDTIDTSGACDNGCVWEKTNGPGGGKTLSIVIDPIDTDILYTGTYPLTDNNFYPDDGGVYKSYDAGLTWDEKSRGIDNKEIWAVKIDPNDNDVLYAGSNDGDIYKSTNAAGNWAKVKDEGEKFETIFSIEVNPGNSNIVFAGSRYGRIYRSENGGGSWETIHIGEGLDTDGVISSIHISPHDSNIVFATSGFADVWDLDSRHGVFKSIDNGQTWAPATNGLEGNENFGDTAFDPLDENVVYAVNGLLGEEQGHIFRSDNLGESWSMIHTAGGYPEFNNFTSFEIHYEQPNIFTMYASGDGMALFKSIDSGETWEYMTSGVMSPDNGGSFITGISLDPDDPDKIYIASYASGNFRSVNGGETWEEINDNITFSYTKAVAPNYSSRGGGGVYASSFTNGIHKTNGSLDWQRILNNGLGVNGFARLTTTPADSNLIYGVGDLIINNGGTATEEFRVSYDKGGNWQIITLPLLTTQFIEVVKDPTRNPVIRGGQNVFSMGAEIIATTEAHVFSAAIDPNDADIAYAATIDGGVYRTDDKGQNWFSKNNGLWSNTNIRTVAIDPSNSNRIYAGAVGDDPEIYSSNNKGESWDKLNDPFTLTNISGHSQLQIDPVNKNKVLAGTWGGGTFMSTDAGENWDRLGTDDWDAPFSPTCLAIAPSNPDIIYACDRTEAQIWRHNNGGVDEGSHNWFIYENFGEDYITTSAIAIDPNNPNKVYVAAFKPPSSKGGGLFVKENHGDEPSFLGEDLPRSVLDIAIDPNDPGTIYVTLHVHGVYKSVDGGEWEQLDDQGNGLPRTGFFDIDVDPVDSNIIYTAGLCGELPDYIMPQNLIPKILKTLGIIKNIDPDAKCGVYKSMNAGEDWELVLETIGAATSVEVDNENHDVLYVSDSGGGVWVSINSGWTWVKENTGGDGLGSLSMTSVKVKDDRVYAATQGSGVYAGQLTDDYSIVWDDQRSNKPKAHVYNMQITVDPEDSDVIYASAYPGGLFRSDDGGQNWSSKNFATPTFRLNDPDRKGYYAFAINPKNPNNVVVCLFRKGCFISFDKRDTSIPFNTGLENKDVYSITFDPSGKYIYAGTNGGSVFRSKMD
jgi:photosystem II stability/assembly factor-like uncharacterized protein